MCMHACIFVIQILHKHIETHIDHRSIDLRVGGCGWCWRGVLIQFPPFRYFPHFPTLSTLWINMLAIAYHIYIRQVSPQSSCSDISQIWIWLKESNRYFCKIENSAKGEINERSLRNPRSWTTANQDFVQSTSSPLGDIENTISPLTSCIILQTTVCWCKPGKREAMQWMCYRNK